MYLIIGDCYINQFSCVMHVSRFLEYSQIIISLDSHVANDHYGLTRFKDLLIQLNTYTCTYAYMNIY